MTVGFSPLWPFPVPPEDPTYRPPDVLGTPAPPPVPEGGPPAPPEFVPPDLLSAPPPGFRERLAATLASTPAFQPSRGTTGGQALVGGLLSGAARGFGQAEALTAKTAEVDRERKNTVRKAEADRNWANAQETWRARLREYYKAKPDPETGKVKVTREMASAMGVPSAVGTMVDPVSAGNLIARREQATRPASTGGSRVYGSMVDKMEPAAVAQRIAEGTMPPDLAGYGRPFNSAVASILARDYPDFDFTRANTDFKAVQRRFMSLNTSTQVRFQQAIDNVKETIDLLGEYLNEAERVGAKYGIRTLNKMYERLNKEGFGADAEARDAVTRLQGLGTTLQFELAVMYQGGGVPTDQANSKASNIIDPSADLRRLRKQLEVAMREAEMRQGAINTAGPVTPTNPAGQNSEGGSFIGGRLLRSGQEAPAPPPRGMGGGAGAVEEWVRDPKTGKLVKAGAR